MPTVRDVLAERPGDPEGRGVAARYPRQFPHGVVGWVPGWFGLLEHMVGKVQACLDRYPDPGFHWRAIGVRNGRLSVRHTGGAAVSVFIAEAVEASRHVCQVCGRRGRGRWLEGQWMTLCPLHLYEKIEALRAALPATGLPDDAGAGGMAVGQPVGECQASDEQVVSLVTLSLQAYAIVADRLRRPDFPFDTVRRLNRQLQFDSALSRAKRIWLGNAGRDDASYPMAKFAIAVPRDQRAQWEDELARVHQSLPEVRVIMVDEGDRHEPHLAHAPLEAISLAVFSRCNEIV